jgi:hypothetical protein
MQVLIFCRIRLQITFLSRTTFLDRSLSPNNNFGPCFFLHSLLGVPTRADDQSNEIVTRILLNRNVQFLVQLWWLVVGRRFECRVLLDKHCNHFLPLPCQFLTSSVLPCVDSDAHVVIYRLWRR